MGPELGVLSHQRPHHGADVRVALVLQRVEERVLLGLALYALT